MTEKRGSKFSTIKHRNNSIKVEKEISHADKTTAKAEKQAVKHTKKVTHELEEEFFVPSPIHRGKYRIPLGIRFLIGYLIFMSVLYLVSFISGLSFPTTILFGKLIVGEKALIINIVLLALVGLMIFGFWKRKAFTFDLAISFFSFSALNSLLSLTLFETAEVSSFRKMMLLSFITLLFMNIVVVWYILHERKFFYAKTYHDRPVQQRDRVFLYTIVSFWFISLLIGGTLGIQFYKDSKDLIDDSMELLGGRYDRGEKICATQEGPHKDVCFLVLATARSVTDPANVDTKLCDMISSEFYRFSCMRTIG